MGASGKNSVPRLLIVTVYGLLGTLPAKLVALAAMTLEPGVVQVRVIVSSESPPVCVSADQVDKQPAPGGLLRTDVGVVGPESGVRPRWRCHLLR